MNIITFLINLIRRSKINIIIDIIMIMIIIICAFRIYNCSHYILR